MAIKPIQILINAKDEASGVFDKLQKKVATVGVAILGYFGIKAFVGAVQGAADLEAKLSEVQAVSGATAEEMQRMRQAAEEAGASTKFTATQSAEALGNLARAGLDVSQSIAALPGVLALAQAGDIGLAESAEITTKALAGFGLEAEKSGQIADVLAKGANASNTSVLGLAQGLSYAAPTAKSLNLSLETTVALLGKFADGGIDASRGGTALNAILSQFLSPASKFRQELAAMGITTTNFEQALHQMAAAGPGASKAILAVGTEAGPALRSLLNQGIGAFDELKAALDGAQGSAAATAATMENNLLGSVRGLGSAWDTVKNTLTTPLLPVLRDGVIQLTDALRGAVTDGTIGKFGEAIAASFKSGIEWVRQFLATIDFKQVAADMRGFADRTREVFDEIGQYATNAGNIVKTAYGVMSAGTNTVLTAVYGIGTAFAEVASTVMSGIALLRDGLAKVTFGGLSASFKAAADDARESAGAYGAVADAMRKKATEAMDAVANGAQLARDGWAGLTEEVDKSTKVYDTSSRAMATMVEEIKKVAAESDAARKATADKQQADEAAAKAVAQLKAEYRDLIASGDLQGAADKIVEINKALRDTPSAAASTASAASASAEEISAAFQRMGIQSKAELKQAADAAKADFDLIKQSGQATAEGLQTAFQKYAEAAIAANGGTATETLKAEAAMLGLDIAADKTGKTIVRAMKVGADAADALTTSINKASAAAAAAGKYSRPGEAPSDRKDPGRGSPYAKPGQDPRNADGQTQAEYQRAQKLAGQAATDERLRFELLAKLQQGTLTKEDLPALRAMVDTLKANQAIFDSLPIGLSSLGGLADDKKWAAARTGFEQAIATLGGGSASGSGAAAVGRRVVYDLRVNDDSYPISIDENDRDSAYNMDAFMSRIARDKRRAAR